MKNYLALLLGMCVAFNLFSQAEEATLLGNWKDTTLTPTRAFNNPYNEVWGVAVNGREFAVVGTTFGTHFIDVTDPLNPTEVVRIEGKDTGEALIHRDFHDYNGYLYAVADEGFSSLQILDITTLPDSVTVVYDSDDLITQAHNIFIDTANAKLYTFAGFSTSLPMASGVMIFDISTPDQPVHLGSYNQFAGLSPSHVHDGYIRNNIAFLNCERFGLAIVDYSDPDNPEAIGSLPSNAYQQSGYNHSGWANDDGSYYYMLDETWGTDIKAVNLSDRNDLEVSTYFDAGNPATTSIPHNALVGCNYLYTSYYYDGLQVYDISDPKNPERVLYYDTSELPDERGYAGAWGVYPHLPSGNILITDMQEGLFVLEAIDSGCDPNANLQDLFAGTTSNKEIFSTNSIDIFPNPLSGNELSITWKGQTIQEEIQISLTNLQGKIMERWEVNFGTNQTINLEFNSAQNTNGIYFLNIRSGHSVTTRKIVINN